MSDPINIVVVEDHRLVRTGIVNLIHSLDDTFKVVAEAENGAECIELINNGLLPHIIIMDLNMPVLNGHETSRKLLEQYPDLKILILTMLDDDVTLIKLIKSGVRGYLHKNIKPDELFNAIQALRFNGTYYNDSTSQRLTGILNRKTNSTEQEHLSEQELKFIELSCSELTYKEIANNMHLSEKTIDGYRAKVFQKLNLKSRVGLVIYAIENNLVSIKP